jgi:succinate dehydrogenase/fumarate reductase flavoprotein subunit
MLNYVKLCGLSPATIFTDVIEIGPAAHFTCGGVKITKECKTNIEGLFAAGEATGGIHGANRLAGNAMTDIFVFGGVAGNQAGVYAKSRGKIGFSQEIRSLIGEEEKRVLSIVSRGDKRGLKPGVIRKKIEETMFTYVGFGRDERGLNKGISMLEGIRTEELPRVYPADRSRIYNYDWMHILELYNMMDTGEMIARGALYRKETRGCQNRMDFPERDDKNWLKHTLIKKEGKRITVSTCPQVRLSQVGE